MANRSIDVDALLQETALEVRVGGELYVLTDVPVVEVIRAAMAEGDTVPMTDLQFLKGTLGATCGDDEERRAKLYTDLDKMGQRGQHALLVTLLDFSDASDLLDKLPVKARVREAIQETIKEATKTGSEPSAIT